MENINMIKYKKINFNLMNLLFSKNFNLYEKKIVLM